MAEKSKKTISKRAKPKAKPQPKPQTPVEEPPAPPPPPPPAPASTGLPGVLWMALALVVLLGGGLATKSLWLGYVVDYLPRPNGASPQAAEADRIGELERELKKLRASGAVIDDLEKQRAGLNESLSTLMKRLDEVEGKLDTVQEMTDVTAPPSDAVDTTRSIERLSERVAGLSRDGEALGAVLQRLAKLEQGLGEQEKADAVSAESKKQAAAQALVLAIGNLRESLKGDQPFTRALDTVQRLGGDEPDIGRAAALKPHAAGGIPTLQTLRMEYGEVARAIVDATPVSGNEGNEGDGLLKKTLNRITSLVTVRRVDGDDAAVADGQLAGAWQNLERGGLAEAVRILSALDAPARAPAEAWLKQARARIDADAMISSLNVLAVSLLVPAGE